MKKVLIMFLTCFVLFVVGTIIHMSMTPSFIIPSFQKVDTKFSQKVETVKKSNYYNDIPTDPSKSGIDDNYGFFDDDMLDGLTMLVQDKAEQLDMNIYVYIAGSECKGYSDYKTECFADDSYDEIYGEDTDGVFYFMDFSGKKPAYDYISTSGKAVLMYEENVQSIHDVCQSIMPPSSVEDYSEYTDDVANAISQFLTQLDYYYDEEPSGYYHDESSDKYFYYKGNDLQVTYSPPLSLRMRPLIVAIPVGVIVAFIFYFATKTKYKFKTSANPNAYISHGKTQFTRKDDRFIRTYTTKTKIEHDSGGSSGGGGGHSSSGGHGGGGSHR